MPDGPYLGLRNAACCTAGRARITTPTTSAITARGCTNCRRFATLPDSDVHHAILPKTARLKPDSAKLLAASHRLAGEPWLRVLAPVDMVLHAAAHLFLNEEFSNGLRDLVDLDSLLRHFGAEPGFWERLAARGRELDLARPATTRCVTHSMHWGRRFPRTRASPSRPRARRGL